MLSCFEIKFAAWWDPSKQLQEYFPKVIYKICGIQETFTFENVVAENFTNLYTTQRSTKPLVATLRKQCLKGFRKFLSNP